MATPRLCAVWLISVAALFAACQRGETCMHYAACGPEGWRQTEHIEAYATPCEVSGPYRLDLLLRTSSARPYPFTHLHVEVRTQWADTLTVDTLALRLAEPAPNTTGLALHQHTATVREHYCHRGDTLHVAIRHIMRRETLSGITDVGFRLQPV